MSDSSLYIDSLKKSVNRKLAEYIETHSVHEDLESFRAECNKILLSEDAKRVRAIIPLLIGDCIGLDRERSLVIGVVIEKLHFTSLIHDDVIDEESVRRGFPTLNSLFLKNHAVLIGDLMMCEVISQAMTCEYGMEAVDFVLGAVKNLVAGVIIEQKTLPQHPTVDKYLEMVGFKTGSLFQLAFGLPFIATPHFEAACKCGNTFGLLFQIYDDYLDKETDAPNQNIFHFQTGAEVKKLWDATYGELFELSESIGITQAVNATIAYLQECDYLLPEVFDTQEEGAL